MSLKFLNKKTIHIENLVGYMNEQYGMNFIKNNTQPSHSKSILKNNHWAATHCYKP